MKEIRILIVGGSGFLSDTLARLAVENGHQVWTITRGQQPLPDGVRGLIADRQEHAAFREVVLGEDTRWDLVVDCIGFDASDARQDIAVFRALSRHFVFISTDFVYHPEKRQFPVSEENSAYLETGYGGKKVACELEFVNGDCGDMMWTILRPTHIYGPGSGLGCLPAHSRDPQLIEHLRKGDVLNLVGGGHFLQQPILALDLSRVILSAMANADCHGQIYNVAGPDVVESRAYYHILTDHLGVDLQIKSIPVGEYLDQNSDSAPFLCHRFFDLDKLHSSGLYVPDTPLEKGLYDHLASMLDE